MVANGISILLDTQTEQLRQDPFLKGSRVVGRGQTVDTSHSRG